MNSGALRAPEASWLVPFLLLGLRDRSSYGHELMQSMDEFGFGAIRPGAIYRVLRRMEKEGLVISERDGSDCRLSQRRYSSTGSGRAYLEFWADSLAEYQEAIDVFLMVYEGSARRMRGMPPDSGSRDSRWIEKEAHRTGGLRP